MRGLAFLLLLAAGAAAGAEPALNPLLSDHAVLQRGRPIPVWGTADPGERVTVTLGEASRTVTAGADGAWRVDLPAMRAGGPYLLRAGAAVANDVLIGDVWLCAGQSNMELGVNAALNAWNEIRSANDPQLRLLTVPRRTAMTPQTAVLGLAWQPAGPESVGSFSAACYYMAKELRASQNVPIGAIAASWGGTEIRSWLDAGAIAALGDEESRIFAFAERDPAAANAQFGARWGAWWRAESGDAPGAEPWNASDRLTWSPAPRAGYWEQWGIPGFADFNGMVWMRKRFTLTPAQAAQGGTLSLTVVDELDQTFVNDVAIGNRYSWEAPRDYRVPAGVLRAGANEVMVNIYDGAGMGGFSGPAERIRLTLADGAVVPLGEGWEYSVARVTGNPPRAPWDEAMGFTRIHSGMIAPLGPYGLTGIAWYQGESDVGLAGSYADRLGALMAVWRRQFGRDLPFLIVGLANYGPYASAPVESGWAALREQQRLAAARDPRAALVVAMDLGERLDIHPGNKAEVGRRLARAARALAYGSGEPAGPQIAGAARVPGGGYVLRFSGVTGALRSWSGNVVLALELCGAGPGTCRYAEGRVDGQVVRIADDGREATRIRYAWADSPVTNLYDDVPLPVAPFEVPIQ